MPLVDLFTSQTLLELYVCVCVRGDVCVYTCGMLLLLGV